MRVTLEHVCLTYEGLSGEKNPALVDVSLDLGGGVTGLMGRTGSGKTSLLEVIAGATPPDSGRVRPCGDGEIDLVFQLPERQFFEPTVEREVTFGLRERGLSMACARERAARALALMGLDLAELAGRSPFSLSGGQRRRVAIASVLALRPSVLLLDEPTAGLDPRARRACLDAVRAAAGEGATVVMASHDANALAEVADRLVVLEEGRVTLDGAARTLLADAPLMRAHGLEPACAARAAAALRRAGVAVPGCPLTAKELADALARRGGIS